MRINKKAGSAASTETDKSRFTKINRCKLPVFAFFIALVMEVIIFALKGIAPFGTKSVLAIDMYHQYAPFLMELRHRILEGKDLFYSWEAGLGRDLYVQTAYYTTSVLDYIYLLFPEDMISECIALLVIVKTALCAPAYQIYLSYRYKRNDALSVLFSLLYCFCGFVTCYYWNIMWLDIVFLFPFLIIGLEELILNEKPLIYWISLSLIMFANFYLAVMVCIFTVLYAVKIIIGRGRFTKKEKDRERLYWVCFLFIVFSILAAFVTGFILAPAGLAISQNVRTSSEVPNFEIYKCVPQLLSAHFTGARPSVMSLNEDAPNLYSGVITLMLLPLYWKASSAARREKKTNIVFLLLLLVCSIIKPLDFIVHGFYFPANLPHRYVFIYSFLLISMAYDAMAHLDELTDNMVYVEAAVLSVLLAFLEFVVIPMVPDIDPVLENYETFMNIGLLFVYGFLLRRAASKKRSTRRLAYTAVCILMLFECIYMGYGCIEQTTEREEYISDLLVSQKEDEYLRENAEELFFRTDYARGRALNEGSRYHFNGFSCFSSMVPARLASIMKTFGAVQTTKSFKYYDSTPLMNAVFSVKYLFSREEGLGVGIGFNEIEKKDKSLTVYENPYCLSLGYMVSKDFDTLISENSYPFRLQNDFLKKASGTEEDMFTLLEVEKKDCQYVNFLSEDEYGGFSYQLPEPAALEKVPIVQTQYICPKDMYLFIYADSSNTNSIYVSREKGVEVREFSSGNGMLEIGNVKKGEKIILEFGLDKRGEFDTKYQEFGQVFMYAAEYNHEVFEKGQEILAKNQLSLDTFTDRYIQGEITADREGYLMTSIPYTSGWHCKVDGVETNIVPLCGEAFVGIGLTKGQHVIEFRYTMPGQRTGIMMSCMGMAVFVLYAAYLIIHKRKKNKMEKV